MRSSRCDHSSTFVVDVAYLTTFFFLLQDDVNVYRSSPPLPGIFCPSHLVPSAYAQPSPDSEDSSEIEGFSSNSETDNAEAGEAARDDGRGCSASPSEDTQVGQPKGTRKLPAEGE